MDIYKNAEQLEKIPLLSGCSKSQLGLLAFCSEAVCFTPGEVLFHLDDYPDCVYVILEGEVDIIWDKDPDNLMNLATLGKNTLVGEIGVFLNQPRISSIVAKDHAMTLKIPANRFLKLVSESPDVALKVMQQLSKKFSFANQVAIQAENEIRQLRKKENNQNPPSPPNE